MSWRATTRKSRQKKLLSLREKRKLLRNLKVKETKRNQQNPSQILSTIGF